MPPVATSGQLSPISRFPILRGSFVAFLLASIGTVIVFLLAQYGNLSDHDITIAAYVIHCFAVLFGAMSASKVANERGWFYGGLTGLLYALCMVAIGLFVYNTFTIDASGLFRVLLMGVIGAFGGIIGLSLRRDD